MLDTVLRSNENHKHFLYEHAVEGVVQGGKVLLVGLSFKAGSDDLRESANVDIARKLIEAGYQLSVYDPELVPAKLIGQNLGYAYTLLPMIDRLLISREEAELSDWDLAIDSFRILDQLNVRTAKRFSTNALV